MNPINFLSLSDASLSSEQTLELLESYNDSFAKMIPSSIDSRFSSLVLKEFQMLSKAPISPDEDLSWSVEHIGENPSLRMAAVAQVIHRLLCHATSEPFSKPLEPTLPHFRSDLSRIAALKEEASTYKRQTSILEAELVVAKATSVPLSYICRTSSFPNSTFCP